VSTSTCLAPHSVLRIYFVLFLTAFFLFFLLVFAACLTSTAWLRACCATSCTTTCHRNQHGQLRAQQVLASAMHFHWSCCALQRLHVRVPPSSRLIARYGGWPDGGHLVPGYGRLWELYTYEQLIGSVASTAITVFSWWAGYTYFGGVLPYLFW
jgi:hypothetical protein